MFLKSKPVKFMAETLLVLGAAVMSTIFAAYLLGYGSGSLEIPRTYDGDGLYYAALIKGVLENGWFLTNPDLGAPFGQNMAHFPMVDGSHFAMLKIVGYLAGDFGTTQNLFLLLSYFTAVISAYVVMRWTGISPLLSTCGAVLFSLQPYHFIRGSHLFLASYFCIPAFVWFSLKLYQLPDAFEIRWARALGLAALLLVISSCGVYYAFFGLLMIAFATMAASIEQKALRPARIGLAACGIILLGVALNLAPWYMSRQTHDESIKVAERNPIEAEIYGLRLTQLALPSPAHQSKTLNDMAREYNEHAPNVNENWTSSLGLVGLTGFVISMFAFFFLPRTGKVKPLTRLGAMNIVALLYGTVGGFGAVFAWVVSPQLRGMNRISILIAFISLCAFFWCMQRLCERIANSRLRVLGTLIVALSIGLFGLWDQIPGWQIQAANRNRTSFEGDKAVANSIMQRVPKGSSIYQMPYVPYPEGLPAFREGGYGLLRPYLHSKDISWSFGAMRELEGDEWIRAIESMPVPERLERLAASGFSAVFLHRVGYEDSGNAVESQISALLGSPTFVCPDASCALYRLESSELPESNPLLLAVRGDGIALKADADIAANNAWVINRNTARIYLLNPLKSPVEARLQFSMTSESTSIARATLGPLELVNMHLKAGETRSFDEVISLPGGISTMKLHTTRDDDNVEVAHSSKASVALNGISIAGTGETGIRHAPKIRSDKIFSSGEVDEENIEGTDPTQQ